MIITVRDSEKAENVEIAKRFVALGYTIYSTSGTAKAPVGSLENKEQKIDVVDIAKLQLHKRIIS